MKLRKLVYSILKKKKITPNINNINKILGTLKFVDTPDEIETLQQVALAKNIIYDAIHTIKVTAGNPAINNNTCPICNKPMQDVSLINGRVAKYCPTHKVTLPIKED